MSHLYLLGEENTGIPILTTANDDLSFIRDTRREPITFNPSNFIVTSSSAYRFIRKGEDITNALVSLLQLIEKGSGIVIVRGTPSLRVSTSYVNGNEVETGEGPLVIHYSVIESNGMPRKRDYNTTPLQ